MKYSSYTLMFYKKCLKILHHYSRSYSKQILNIEYEVKLVRNGS